MLTRIITGLVIVAVMAAAIFLLPTLYFSIFCAVILGFAAKEWVSFSRDPHALRAQDDGEVAAGRDNLILQRSSRPFRAQDDRRRHCEAVGSNNLISTVTYFIIMLGLVLLAYHYLFEAVLIGAVFWLIAMILILSPMKCTAWLKHPVALWLSSMLGLVPAWAAIVLLHSEQLHLGVIYVIIITALSDTGAYFTGKRLGRHRLAPNLSPKKTWEGAVGGLILATIVAVGFVALFDAEYHHLIWVTYVSAVMVVVAMLGDLFESLLKRQCHIKDSGNILPGHGGVLDRIDSIIAVLPVFALIELYLGVFQ